MSTPIRSLIYAPSYDCRVQIHSEVKEKSVSSQESELKENLSKIPSTSITIHPAPRSASRLVRVKPKGSKGSEESKEPEEPKKAKQSKPLETPLEKLAYSIHLTIAALLKYKDIVTLSLTCHYFQKNLSVERMIEGTAHSPEQAWEKFVMSDYLLDYQHYVQKGLSMGSFHDFYKECSFFHRCLKTSNLATFPKFDLTIKIETNKHNALDINRYGIVTLSNAFLFAPEIILWDALTGSPLVSSFISNVNPLFPITALKCNDTEIAFTSAEGIVQFLGIEVREIEDKTGKKSGQKSIALVEGDSFNINHPVRTLALAKDWCAWGTQEGLIIMYQGSSGKRIGLQGHQGSVDYLEFMGDGCIASASRNLSRITVWTAACHEGDVDWNEEDASSPIILNMSFLDDQPGIRCLHWSSPDRLYSGDSKGTIRVWNPLQTRSFLCEVKVHDSPISSIQTVQDLIMSTGENGRVALVNENAQLIRSYLASTALVRMLGPKIATISLDGNVQISMLTKKSVKVLRRITQNTTAKKVACIALVVIIVGLIVFFSTRDKN